MPSRAATVLPWPTILKERKCECVGSSSSHGSFSLLLPSSSQIYCLQCDAKVIPPVQTTKQSGVTKQVPTKGECAYLSLGVRFCVHVFPRPTVITVLVSLVPRCIKLGKVRLVSAVWNVL